MSMTNGPITSHSLDSPLFEFDDTGVDTTPPVGWQHTAVSLLHAMRSRIRAYGSPLPEGYVAPPGIDLDDLLRQVPWPPPAEPN